jgi:hypothetical protein
MAMLAISPIFEALNFDFDYLVPDVLQKPV